MAKPKIDYALELGEAPQAVQSRAGELTIAASQKEANAINIEGKAAADLVSFLGTTAVDAYKGKLQAGVADGTDKAIDEFMRPQQNIENARDEYQQITAQAADSGNPVSKEYIDQLNRYVAAQETGALTRTQTIDRIAAEVKKYSAMMPGWAADFRKIAAEKTGISNIDVYGVHKALTQKGLGELRAEKQQEIELNLLKQVAEAKGYTSLSQVTETDRATFAAAKQMQLAAQRITAEQTVKKATQDEANSAWGQVHQFTISQKAMEFAGELATLSALTGDTTKGAEAARASLQLTTKLGTWIAQVEANIAEMTKPVQGRTPLAAEQADKMRADWRATAKVWQDAVKEVESRDLLGAIVKNAGKDVELMAHTFKKAHPHLTNLNTFGSVGELTKAWLSLNGKKEDFSARFGPTLADAMEKVFTAPQIHANLESSVLRGDNPNLAPVAALSRELAIIQQENNYKRVETITTSGVVAKPSDIPTLINSGVNLFTNSNLANRTDVDRVSKLISDTRTQSFILSNLSAEERVKFTRPLLEKANAVAPQYIQQVKTILADMNGKPEYRNSIGELSVEVSPIGQLELFVNKAGVKSRFVSNNSDAAVSTLRGRKSSNEVAGATEAYAVAEDMVGRLNKLVSIMGVSAMLIAGDKADSKQAVSTQVYKAITTEDFKGPLVPSLLYYLGGGTQSDAPKSTPKAPSEPVSAADFPKVTATEQAQRDAEATKLLQGEAKQRLARDGREVLMAEASAYKAQLQSKDLEPTIRKLLTKELQVLEFALNEAG